MSKVMLKKGDGEWRNKMTIREMYVVFAGADTTEIKIIGRDETGMFQTIYEHGTLEDYYNECCNSDIAHYELLNRKIFWFEIEKGKMIISVKGY